LWHSSTAATCWCTASWSTGVAYSLNAEATHTAPSFHCLLLIDPIASPVCTIRFNTVACSPWTADCTAVPAICMRFHVRPLAVVQTYHKHSLCGCGWASNMVTGSCCAMTSANSAHTWPYQ
jgi:hypothetical protein